MTTDPDYAFPSRTAAPKKGWTIWSIKNRWLRAAVAWPVLILSAIGLVVFAIILAVGAGVLAVCRVAGEEATSLAAAWHEMRTTAWAAMTGKDEPA